MRKWKVWGGTHPNEQIGLDVADSLIADPVDNVDGGIANPRARKLGQRYVDIGLDDAYPGNPASPLYEERRAYFNCAASLGYYGVCDFHGNNYLGGDTAYIGSNGVSGEILGFLADLNIRTLVLTGFNGLHEHVYNSFLVDIGSKSFRASVPYWRDAFYYVANARTLPIAKAGDFNWFEHRGDIKAEQVRPERIPWDFEPFGRVPDDVERDLGHLVVPIHLINWRESAESGVWAEICTPIATPDDSAWPMPV